MPIKRRMIIPFAVAVSFTMLSQSWSQVPLPPILNGPTSSEAGVIHESIVVLQELTRTGTGSIPEYLLKEAQALAIIPHYVRGAFVVGVAGGRGVLVTRDATGRWQAPEFITMGGGSVGWQAGVQATDLVLVFRSTRSLANIRSGKLTLGADVSAAAGPIGRYMSAATDARLEAEILTYSRSRGLFAGVSLSGASLQMDPQATQRFYQLQPNGGGAVPPSAAILVNELNRFAAPPLAGVPNFAGVQTGQVAPGAQIVPSTAVTLGQLQQSVATLQAKVDDQWKQYLALPPSMQPGQQLLPQELDEMVIRYERVATNPQFESLRVQPEFQSSLDSLRRLSAEVRQTDPLHLPAPPNIDIPVNTRGRY